jgi:dienelactone hydrolase
MTRREQLYGLLGDLPERERAISARIVSSEERGGFVLERWLFEWNGFENVPAYFAKPRNLAGKAPVILYQHYHGGRYNLGKDELLLAKPEAGLPSYAESLTDAGYCVFCADTWVFGERATRSELDVFKEMLWRGQVLWGMMLYDALRAVDYVSTRSDVDASRIATLGMSMGSTMSWWLAALDERIKVCVDLCCLTDYDALIETGGLCGHGVYYYVPGLLKHFSAAQINALIAPRAHLSLAGTRDPLTPVAGLDRIDTELKEVYAQAGVPRNWKLLRYDVAHSETAEMRQAALAFLRENL